MEISTMRAVQYSGYGGGAVALEHVEIPIPTPNKDEILIKLEAASINPIDWKIQQGMLRPVMPPKFPFTPGIDAAGEVVALGSGVNSFKEGDKVVSVLKVANGGGLAEYTTATAALTVLRPLEISPAEATGIPTAALTAFQALKSVGVTFNGNTSSDLLNILITAASGGVGLYTVQLAKLANLHVTATCGARNIQLVKTLGADEVVDYKTLEGSTLKSPSGKKYDAVIHCATGMAWSTFEPNLSAKGTVIDITPTAKTVFASFTRRLMFCRKKLVGFLLMPKVEELKYLMELMKEGKIKTVVDSKYPLQRAEEAWAKSMEGHATGKIVVEM